MGTKCLEWVGQRRGLLVLGYDYDPNVQTSSDFILMLMAENLLITLTV